MITQNDLVKIKNVVEEVFDEKFKENFNRSIKPINKKLNKIQKDLTITINYFDHLSINHEKRIGKIEHRLNPSSNT